MSLLIPSLGGKRLQIVCVTMYTGVLLSVGIMRCDLIYFNLAESMRPDSTIYGKAILSLTLVCL